jgi:predicted Zn-dependent peptidase
VQNGATGFDVRPTADFSDLAMTFSSEKAELWFRMVGSWLQAPSSRFFALSRDLVVDQRERASKTGGVQRERAYGAAFTLHPYQTTASGDGELSWAGPDEVRAFIKTHYMPANLTIAIVGDIPAQDARRLAEFYFGKLPPAAPTEARTAEPLKAENAQPTKLVLPEPPVFSAGWPRPAGSDRDDVVFDVLQGILTGGPGSRLHSELMVEGKVANRVGGASRFPGGRYPSLFVLDAEPLPTRSPEEVENGIHKVIDAIAKSGVTAEDLQHSRQWWRKRLLIDSRPAAGRAAQLVRWHTEHGTYKIDEWLAKLDAVTAADCQRVVTEYLAAKPYFSVVQLTAVTRGAAQ